MGNTQKKALESITSPFLLPFPTLPNPTVITKEPQKVVVSEFYTHSDGQQKTFTITDCLQHIGEQSIINACDVSFMNLFINGVLQPKANYDIQNGTLVLRTIDAPIEGAPIILQTITL